MTATSSPAHGRVARRFARACIIGVAALAVAVSAVLVPPPAYAAPTPSPSASQLSGKATLTLAPLGRGIVPQDEGLSAYVTLDNGTASEIDGGPVSLSAGTAPLTDRAALSAWLAGDRTGVELMSVGAASMDTVSSGGSSPVLVQVPPAQTQRAPGIYPLLASFDGPDGPMTAASVMIVSDPAQPQGVVGVVVPITAGPLSAGLLTSDQLSALTAPGGELSGLLDAVTGTSAILAVDPAIPAAIRVLGNAAPADATAWLDRLISLPNERFALQFGDADIAAQINAGRTTLSTPLELSSYLDPTHFPADTGGATPAPTATPTLPDMKALTYIGAAVPGMYWPFSGTATSKVLSVLRTADTSATTLVASASTAAGAGSATAPADARIDAARVLLYDSAISTQLADASTAADPPHRGDALAAATAHLILAEKEAAGAPLLVTIDRRATRDAAGLRAAIDTASSSATPATLGSLAGTSPTTTTFGATDPDTARTAAFTALETDEQALHDFSSVLNDPAVLTGPERAQILQLIGGGWVGDDQAWTAALAAHRAQTAKTLGSVRILAPSELLVLSSGADLRFWVRNDLPWPVNVTLHAAPDSQKLIVQPTTDVQASAASNTRAIVPVRARVGNGEVSVSLWLRSPTGVLIGATQVADVNVRADWEAFGLSGLAVLVVVLLGLGVYRTLRRRRRMAAAPDASAQALLDASAQAPAGAPAEPSAGAPAEPSGTGSDLTDVEQEPEQEPGR
jgi:hypothetical protein